MRRLLPAVALLLAVGCSGDPEPVVAGRSETTTTVPPPTTTTVAPTTTTTLTAEAALASALVAAETAIRNPSTPAADLPALGQTQQQSYRRMVADPALADAVLELVPARLRPTVEANVAAGRELSALTPASL